jgi:hypothetical protein
VLVDEQPSVATLAPAADLGTCRVFYRDPFGDPLGTTDSARPLDGDWDAIWLVTPREELTTRELRWIDGHLARGRPLVLVVDERAPARVAAQLLGHLGANGVVRQGQGGYSATRARLHGEGTQGESLDVAPWTRLRVAAGEPWIWVEADGASYDIARRFPATESRGETIIFYQSRFWRTEFLGGADGPGDPGQHAAWELQWLAAEHLLRRSAAARR